ncbi:hypothetical protein AK812_SmicGene36831 [Symbiodinium microadriaticum]|uniref:Uncharacterized protein n=1 Tax=Symbiodinium microadriaticum TaxID=2951 RepID=A0A1Q9CHV0_SYMMI|nr:hypothetical protein AK812_SmicGene36831 [Symbiodinium microadriaticum]
MDDLWKAIELATQYEAAVAHKPQPRSQSWSPAMDARHYSYDAQTLAGEPEPGRDDRGGGGGPAGLGEEGWDGKWQSANGGKSTENVNNLGDE